MHDYWNFALIVPFAVGTAICFGRVERALQDRFAERAGMVVIIVASLVGLASVARPSNAELTVRSSLGTPTLIDVAAELAPEDGPVMAFVSGGGSRSPWMHYESHRDALPLDDFDALSDLARTQPGFPVLVISDAADPDVRAALLEDAVATKGPWSIVTAADADAAYSLRGS